MAGGDDDGSGQVPVADVLAKRPGRARRVAAIVLAAVFFWSEGPKLFGLAEAGWDVLWQQPKWKVHGEPPPPGDDGDARFMAKYGVPIESVGSCIVGRGTADYAATYDAVIAVVKRIPHRYQDEYWFITVGAWSLGLLAVRLWKRAH
ncbi:MAG TPA: hypothetical protein VFQ35_01770 [Polyangiaceae bacterium]|nr:hypothetical protein [Polyangiaceae bacterium]